MTPFKPRLEVKTRTEWLYPESTNLTQHFLDPASSGRRLFSSTIRVLDVVEVPIDDSLGGHRSFAVFAAAAARAHHRRKRMYRRHIITNTQTAPVMSNTTRRMRPAHPLVPFYGIQPAESRCLLWVPTCMS